VGYGGGLDSKTSCLAALTIAKAVLVYNYQALLCVRSIDHERVTPIVLCCKSFRFALELQCINI
jgi:hypothetical protein